MAPRKLKLQVGDFVVDKHGCVSRVYEAYDGPKADMLAYSYPYLVETLCGACSEKRLLPAAHREGDLELVWRP